MNKENKIWYEVANIEDIPKMGSRLLQIKDTQIAIFKTNSNDIFAINNICPHKKGFLSDGLVHDDIITCPLHNWEIDLKSGKALNEDKCTNIYDTLIKDNIVYINI